LFKKEACKKKMNKETLDKIIVFVLGILLVGNALLGFYVYKYKEAFTQNPLTFGIKKIDNTLQCTCYSSNVPNKVYFINSSNIGWKEQPSLNFNTN